ncbi:hypothetical protein C2G38_599080 [Gigaspora rosea]|uniref:Uncharacterized protein n=1 Tax=Gigaspora rosea TaxID=44941 RepID=A0A397VSU5_9GLOM|nr:hypothetical protein C2G38_599080 [Gigaspora rosea]
MLRISLVYSAIGRINYVNKLGHYYYRMKYLGRSYYVIKIYAFFFLVNLLY